MLLLTRIILEKTILKVIYLIELDIKKEIFTISLFYSITILLCLEKV